MSSLSSSPKAGEVHHAGAVGGGDVVGVQHHVRVRVPEEVAERRGVPQSHQLGALTPADDPRARAFAELPGVGGQPGLGQQVAFAPPGDGRLHHHVVDVVVHRHGQVGRQSPRRRRPDQRELPGLQPVPDRDRRVPAHLVDVLVHPQLVRGQRGLVVPAVRQAAEALVGQAVVVELLERPHDAFHVGQVQRLVIVVEVDPAGLPGDVVAPFLGVAQHGLAARLVELGHAELVDLFLGLDAELAHRLELGGQAVGIPAEAPFHPLAAHGLVARDQVLHVAGQQVAVVRQAVRERRAVVEHELVRAVLARGAVLHRRAERVVGRPVPEHPLLDLGKARAGRYAIGQGRLVGRGLGVAHR